jgi:hypothetical protein
MIARGMRVSWETPNGTIGAGDLPPTKGHGVTVSEETEGHVFVAVLSAGPMHHVIWCNATWLTVEAAP